ncbi:ABC transporter permease [Agaribacterium haliotis]|uniref:ABC transporter permease n=1 Tax=Agaribacterium haliotis TaxID=2013869 RepID=UPI000BB5685E|nr:ABC transporter permease [Agaribacterium haliotis]
MRLIRFYLRSFFFSFIDTWPSAIAVLLSMALGMSIFVSALLLYRAVAFNPLSEINDTIFLLQIDHWSTSSDYDYGDTLPRYLSYTDASALAASELTPATALMYQTGGNITADSARLHVSTPARATSSGFFSVFPVSFLFGGAWSSSDDKNKKHVVVLSKELNDRLFQGKNSVGEEVIFVDQVYEVVGVLDTWSPKPKVHDLGTGPFGYQDGLYLPFELAIENKLGSWGSFESWQGRVHYNTFDKLVHSETGWLQLWLYFPDRAAKMKYQEFLTNYIARQITLGRPFRSERFELKTPDQVLKMYRVVNNTIVLTFLSSSVFLLLCFVNSTMLVFVRQQHISFRVGLHRALGARNTEVLWRFVLEALVFSVSSMLLALLLSPLFVSVLKKLPGGQLDVRYASMDLLLLISALCLCAFLVVFIPMTLLLSKKPAQLLRGA